MNQVFQPEQFQAARLDVPCTPHCSHPCDECGVRHHSICSVLDENELAELASIQTSCTFDTHDPIVTEGDPAAFFFNVTKGAVLLYKLLPNGRRQITGFLFPGDFMGIAAEGTFAYSAEALLPSRLCRFSKSDFISLLDRMPKLERRLLTLASHELVEAQEQMLLLGRKTAKERLCTFLLSLSHRAELKGADPQIVSIPMSRADIADYLGLTMETVSRNFTNLKTSGLIQLREGGMVFIPDRTLLAEMAEDS